MFVAACHTLHRRDKNFNGEYLLAPITSLCSLVTQAKNCFLFLSVILLWVLQPLAMKQVQYELKMTEGDIFMCFSLFIWNRPWTVMYFVYCIITQREEKTTWIIEIIWLLLSEVIVTTGNMCVFVIHETEAINGQKHSWNLNPGTAPRESQVLKYQVSLLHIYPALSPWSPATTQLFFLTFSELKLRLRHWNIEILWLGCC